MLPNGTFEIFSPEIWAFGRPLWKLSQHTLATTNMTTGHNRRYIPPSFLLVEAIFCQDRPPQYYETVKIFECYSIMVSQSVILHHVPNHLNNLNRGQLCIWNRNNWDHLTITHPFMKLTSIGFKAIFNICLNPQKYDVSWPCCIPTRVHS